jgi:hypothetical protein
MIKSLLISNQQMVSQVEGNIISDMDGEKVMFSIANGKYYNLGEIGGVIWDLLKEPTSSEQIVSNLLEQYDVDQETCVDQVLSFLTMLVEENLIEISE